MSAAPLRYERQPGGGHFAYRGKRIVGMVVKRYDGLHVFELQAVHYKWITEGYGTRKSEKSAMKALDRAWAEWCEAMSLTGATD